MFENEWWLTVMIGAGLAIFGMVVVDVVREWWNNRTWWKRTHQRMMRMVDKQF